MKSNTVKPNKKHTLYLRVYFIMRNKLLFTLFTWSVHFLMRTVGGSENVGMIFNSYPSIGQRFSSDCQSRILSTVRLFIVFMLETGVCKQYF